VGLARQNFGDALKFCIPQALGEQLAVVALATTQPNGREESKK
jgi:hypothetical protein